MAGLTLQGNVKTTHQLEETIRREIEFWHGILKAQLQVIKVQYNSETDSYDIELYFSN